MSVVIFGYVSCSVCGEHSGEINPSEGNNSLTEEEVVKYWSNPIGERAWSFEKNKFGEYIVKCPNCKNSDI